MIFYHGTEHANLERLHPNSHDKQGNPCLYVTDNRAYSIFYLRDRNIDFVTCGVGPDGKVCYDEKFPDQLKILYQGRNGYIYEVDTQAEQTAIRGVWTCRKEARVRSFTFIPDAYQAIWAEIEKGTVVFLPFEQLHEEQLKNNHEGAVRMFLSGKKMNSEKETFYRTHFPKAWEEAQFRKNSTLTF